MGDLDFPINMAPGHSDMSVESFQGRHDSDSDIDSLFDERLEDTISNDTQISPPPSASNDQPEPARLTGPPIPGLYFNPSILLPAEPIQAIMQKCITAYFQDSSVNQVMLFERADRPESERGQGLKTGLNSTLPIFLTDLLCVLSTTLQPSLPPTTHQLLFPPPSMSTRARQVIINHYLPGEGITPHVDLLDRFGDGIIGVSMGSGCVMRFQKVEYDDDLDLDDGHRDEEGRKQWAIYLPSGSVYVMTEEARYEWTHEIEKRVVDWVEEDPSCQSGSGVESEEASGDRGRWIARSPRVSITFRWLLPGADVVGVSG